MHPVPSELLGRVFLRDEALALGVTARMLAGPRYVRIHQGVYRAAGTEPTTEHLVRAALLKVPDAAVSHTTNLRLRGFTTGPAVPIHIATHRAPRRGLEGVVVHRYLGRLHTQHVGGVPLLRPERTFVDCGTLLSERRLLQVGDWLVAQRLTTPGRLREFCLESHLDGVQRARRVAPWIRVAVASPRESDVRWHLLKAGLPEPEVNTEIRDALGEWLARGDLVYREYKVLVEYDGWQHERDAQQRQWDHLRREQLEAAGWRVIVVTAEDMRRPWLIPVRVEQALRQRGYRG